MTWTAASSTWANGDGVYFSQTGGGVCAGHDYVIANVATNSFTLVDNDASGCGGSTPGQPVTVSAGVVSPQTATHAAPDIGLNGNGRIRAHNFYIASYSTPSNPNTVTGCTTTGFGTGGIPNVIHFYDSVIGHDASGMQDRGSSGTLYDVLWIGNPYATNIGQPAYSLAVPPTANINYNVIAEAADLLYNTTDYAGGIVGFGSVSPGCYEGDQHVLGALSIQNSIFYNASSPNGGFGAINLEPWWTAPNIVNNNISCNWPTGAGSTTPNILSGTFTGTNYALSANCTSNGYPAPTRTVGSYYGSIGGSPATTAGYIAAAEANTKEAGWNNLLSPCRVNNYIRGGFNFGRIPCPP